MNPMFYVFAVIALALALEGLNSVIKARRNSGRATAQRRLRKMTERIQAPDTQDDESLLRASDQRSILDRLLGWLPGRNRLELGLYRAGLTISPERFVAMCFGLAAVGFVVGLTFFVHFGKAILCIAIGFAPVLNLRRLQTQRRNEFEKQFPDALDLLIRALRAGHALSSGLAMVGEELPDPLGTEFGHTADQIRLGKSMQSALSNLAYRVDSEDLPFFVTAVAIQQETGSNLAEVLQNLATVMRERFKIFAKVRALTAMGRGTANILAIWPVFAVCALYMVNPGYVSPLWEDPAGHTLAKISVVMVVIGYVLCRKSATIRV
jgi:tight adherence protein B